MERSKTFVYLACICWICILGVTARQDDDIELLEELIESLTDKIGKNDAKDILDKKGVASHSNRNSGSDVKGRGDEAILESLVNDNEEEEAFIRETKAFLKAKRAPGFMKQAKKWVNQDPSIRGSEGTTTATVPPPPQQQTTPAIRFCGFWFWRWRKCRR